MKNWGFWGVVVAIAALVLTWLQPSATAYEEEARTCANNLREMQAAVANLTSIPGRVNNDPNNMAALVAEANRFAVADTAVHTTCPINERVEYIDLLDSSWYRTSVLGSLKCTTAALERKDPQCPLEIFVNKTNSVVACTYSMIYSAEQVTKWSTVHKWQQVFHRWRNNSKTTPDRQTFDKDTYHNPCGIKDPEHPEAGWGGY